MQNSCLFCKKKHTFSILHTHFYKTSISIYLYYHIFYLNNNISLIFYYIKQALPTCPTHLFLDGVGIGAGALVVVWGGGALIGLFWWQCEVLLLDLLRFASSFGSLSLDVTTIGGNGSWIGVQIALRLVWYLICGGRSKIRLCFGPFGLHLGWCYGKSVVDMWIGRSVTVVACGLRLWFVVVLVVDCGFDFVMVNWWLIRDWQIVWVVVRTESMGAWWRWCCVERKRETGREKKRIKKSFVYKQ